MTLEGNTSKGIFVEYSCISADDHIDLRFLPKDIFTERVPAKLKDSVPHVVPAASTEAKGMWDWVVEGRAIAPWGCFTAAQASGNAWAIERGGVLEADVLRPTTAELRLADMDRDGVQASVMYGPPDPLLIDDPEIRQVTFRAYNDWVADFEKAAPERLIGVAQLDYLDPAFSANELERTASLGIRHVNVLAAAARPSWYEAEWERFWSIAEETGIPVGSHLTVVVQRERSDPGNPNYGGSVFSLGQQLVEPYAGLILNGVFDRHPRVKTVMAESQISWVPHMIQTLDTDWTRARLGIVPGHNAMCELKPSEYFANNVWMTFQDDPAGLRMLPLLHEDKVMWASDYPHPSSTWPDSQATIDRQLNGIVDDDTRRKLLFANAQALYGL